MCVCLCRHIFAYVHMYVCKCVFLLISMCICIRVFLHLLRKKPERFSPRYRPLARIAGHISTKDTAPDCLVASRDSLKRNQQTRDIYVTSHHRNCVTEKRTSYLARGPSDDLRCQSSARNPST